MTTKTEPTTLNKRDLVTTVRNTTGFSKSVVDEVITTALEAIKEELAAGNNVQLYKFGTWKAIETSERTIKTSIAAIGERKVPAHNRVKFTPSADFKTQVRTGA